MNWTYIEFHICSVGEKRFECPMCSVVCSDSFSLQEHVELHLDHGAAGNSTGIHTIHSACIARFLLSSVPASGLPVQEAPAQTWSWPDGFSRRRSRGGGRRRPSRRERSSRNCRCGLNTAQHLLCRPQVYM